MAKILSDNASRILAFLQANATVDLTANDIAEALDMTARSVNGTLTGLQKRGLTARFEVEGFEKKVIRLTEEGSCFDPNAEAVEE